MWITKLFEALEQNRAWRVFRHAKALEDIFSYFGLPAWIASALAIIGGGAVTWIASLPVWAKVLVGLSATFLILLVAFITSLLVAGRSPEEDTADKPVAARKGGWTKSIVGGCAIVAALILAAVMSTKPRNDAPSPPSPSAAPTAQALPASPSKVEVPIPASSPVFQSPKVPVSPKQEAKTTPPATQHLAPAKPSDGSNSPTIGNDNTLVNVPNPPRMGSGNTIIGPTDANGNTIINRGGTAIGAGATADPTSIAIGAGAKVGAAQPTTIINNAPGGFAVSGGTLNQPTIVNNGPPEPKISWHQEPSLSGAANVLTLVFELDRMMDIPTFLAQCDRPCKTTGASAQGGGYRQSDYWSFTNPETLVGIVINGPRPLGAGIKVRWEIQSRDENPVRITGMEKTPPDILQQMLSNKR